MYTLVVNAISISRIFLILDQRVEPVESKIIVSPILSDCWIEHVIEVVGTGLNRKNGQFTLIDFILFKKKHKQHHFNLLKKQ
jgi:hypothetical protein